MMSSPTARPCSPFATKGLTSSHASGAPSEPCLGASLRCLMLDRIKPIGRSWARLPLGSGLLTVRCFFSRSEEHTSELQSRRDLVCRLLLAKKISALHAYDAW